jgi:tRNA threonylcarbamoyladenosine modification (KEOPS) complex  Pcc1 subunit
MNIDPRLSIKSQIFSGAELCDFAEKSFSPELKKRKSTRSEINIQKSGNSLKFLITSRDVTAFRGSISEIIHFGKIIEKALDIYRKL